MSSGSTILGCNARYLVALYILVVAVSPTQAIAAWSQDNGNAARTGYTAQEPVTPWSFIWSFNGPDANGGTSAHLYDGPKDGRTVTGAGLIFIPAGNKGLYVRQLGTGQAVWSSTVGTFLAAPVYDAATNSLYAGAQNGIVYKFQASSGTLTGQFSTSSSIRKTPLVVGDALYVVTDAGRLHKISTQNMQSIWSVQTNASADTPPSYSASKDLVIFATADLYVHAVKGSTGAFVWEVKPSPNQAGWPNTFDHAWPVIADQHGIVFLRMQLPHSAMLAYPGTNGIFPNSNAQTRIWLQANPQNKNLFALDLDTGAEKFIPAVGYGSTEDWINNDTHGVMGSSPVVVNLPDGKEVVYLHFRNGQGNPPDYRWDGHMGEMVLDSTTLPGLVAGDFRFIDMARHHGGVGYTDIIDEQSPITVAGTTLFHSHWAAVESVKIVDRSNFRGITFSNPITVAKHPVIIRAIKNCSDKNTATHYASCGLSYVTDGGRYYDGPGFWIYWNVPDPPGWRTGIPPAVGTSYSAGFLPRYTYVSDGYIVVEGNGGDISIFKHSGTSTTPVPTLVPTASPISTKLGDGNGDGKVDGIDYVLWLNNFGITTTIGVSKGDYNKDTKVDGIDYVVWLNNFGI